MVKLFWPDPEIQLLLIWLMAYDGRFTPLSRSAVGKHHVAGLRTVPDSTITVVSQEWGNDGMWDWPRSSRTIKRSGVLKKNCKSRSWIAAAVVYFVSFGMLMKCQFVHYFFFLSVLANWCAGNRACSTKVPQISRQSCQLVNSLSFSVEPDVQVFFFFFFFTFPPIRACAVRILARFSFHSCFVLRSNSSSSAPHPASHPPSPDCRCLR